MATEYKRYPKAKMAIEGGELQDIYDVNIALSAGVKPVHTFGGGGQPSGNSSGAKNAKVSFKSKISQDGFERNFTGHFDTQKPIEGRIKLPGEVIVVTGTLDNLSIASNIDSEIDFSADLTGRYTFAK